MSDPVLHELLAHYGLTDFEEAFAADEFGIENLLQIKTEDDWNGFCEHFEVSGFLFKNRFKTMIAAIPALKRTNRIPAASVQPQLKGPAAVAPSPVGGFPSSAMVPFAGGVNPMMMNPMMQMQMQMQNPVMQEMMRQRMDAAWRSGQAAAAPMQPTVRPAQPVAARPVPVFQQPAAAAAAADGDDSKGDDSMFDTEEAQVGQQVTSIRPWVGTVSNSRPDNWAQLNNPTAPTATLALEWIYGVTCKDVRQHIFFDASNRVVYPAACILVAYDHEAHTQTFYTGPENGIRCVAQHPSNPNVFAVGQGAFLDDKKRSADPFISIIDVGTGAVTKLPAKKVRAMTTIAYSPDGKYLVSGGTDENFTVMVWDTETNTLVASEKAVNKTEVLSFTWNPKAPTEFCGVGKGTVAFYSVAGGKINMKQATFEGQNKDTVFISAAYTEKGTAVVGTKDGAVYAFVGAACKKVFSNIHPDSPISAIFTSFADGLVVTGGNDGKVRVNNSKMEAVATIDVGDKVGVRGVMLRGKSLAIATNQAEVLLVSDYTASAEAQVVAQGHCDGELWAVVPHPTDPTLAASVGEDNKIMLWNTEKHQVLRTAVITDDEGAAARKIQRAASSTNFATNQCARAITFSPDGAHVAVGTNQGKCAVYDASTLDLVALIDLNPFGKANNANPEHWIQCMSYNPSGSALAVGTHGSVICLLDVKANYAVAEKLTAHNAAVTCLDWSTDGKNIQSVCLAYELLFHAITPALKGSAQEKYASKLKATQWATQTCKFGWPVDGLFRFNQGQEGFAIMTTDRSHSKDLQVTGETSKQVNVFRSPCTKEGNKFTSYAGHASHVTSVRFTADDAYLLSTGGDDKCIFQWQVSR